MPDEPQPREVSTVVDNSSVEVDASKLLWSITRYDPTSSIPPERLGEDIHIRAE
jgi:hypothetical protein